MTIRETFALFARQSLRTRAAIAIAAFTGTLALAGCGSDDTTSSREPSITSVISPEGGSMSVGDATMTFPAGAVTTPTTITIARTNEAPPAGFVALSPIFRCEPSGTSFPVKVTMAMTFTGDARGATIFWSSAASPEFTDVGGTVSGKVMSAEVAHFSRGFVGRKL